MQNDIKRVIAYSTCSQLGYMFVGLGVGAYGAGIFHLFTHAFFKALLFLGAGSVIHAMHHEQDMRHMGGLRRYIPFTTAMMAIGTLALTGFPFTAGYFSKDAIIEAAYASHRPGAAFAFLATVVAAFMTSFYSWRLFFMTFEGSARWARTAHHAGTARHEGVEHDEHSRDVEPASHAEHEHGQPRRSHAAREPARDADPAGRAGARRARRRHRLQGRLHRRRLRGVLEGRALHRPDNHILEEMHHVPALGAAGCRRS